MSQWQSVVLGKCFEYIALLFTRTHTDSSKDLSQTHDDNCRRGDKGIRLGALL
jgi:hypothetical protein